MYLTDLSFIEEGTPNVTEQDLVNFSKMRMVIALFPETINNDLFLIAVFTFFPRVHAEQERLQQSGLCKWGLNG